MQPFNPPRKRKREKVKPNERGYPTHRAFVRRHQCCIPGCWGCGPVEFAHLRTAANSGMGIKPADWFGVPMGRAHHKRAHTVGHETMCQENGITMEYLFKTAAYLASRTPDKRMREAMRENAT